jgi:integral membrane protein
LPLRHNGGMTSTFDIRSTAGWFRLVALAEAVSWVGLLVGMYFKYLGSPRTEIGVKVFGMAHGLVFIAFVGTALLAGIAYSWGGTTWLLALLGSIVPLGSVIFLIWADRTAKLGGGEASVASSQPLDSVPSTT